MSEKKPIRSLLIAADHAGFALKERLRRSLEKKGYRVKDLGTYSGARCDYPRYGYALAQEIGSGKAERGILICKSGIGQSIVANRVPGVRAALCYDARAARLSRQHNDANVLVMGSGFVTLARAERIASAWLRTAFEGGRHQRRLDIIKKIEKQIAGKGEGQRR
jgi:RpiB/LacA/LacB family sugar-phosphate isomerase